MGCSLPFFLLYPEDPTNVKTLAAIETSLFLLCLDTSSGISQLSAPVSANTHLSFYDTAIANNSLHGVSSSAYNAGNRWFDKSQFIVSRDGVVVIQQEAGAATSTNRHFCAPRLLDWSISPNLCEKLEIARDLFDTLALDTDVACAKFTAFSKSLIKSARLSPDAFVQIGMQLAYARLYPNRPPPATYESGTLRRFRLGRTETIRSCSAQSVAFTKAMANDVSFYFCLDHTITGRQHGDYLNINFQRPPSPVVAKLESIII
ncbi:unnamed protein product [Dibothriocephalus latus]|uniref:Choline/carnitine acyltransferase domain-containing protein n=1 Tax=Dibothriocephalus latus TaxID=60516 RepID=A0A3P7P1K4_DIBLA|nr:unnamed protein product [Dibothriocephalus latus]